MTVSAISGRISQIMVNLLTAFFMFSNVPQSMANDGEPVAIRYWPGGCTSIESMWNLHVAIGVGPESRALLPRSADVEFVDDFWEASTTDKLVLDRQPNATQAILQPASALPNPSRNAIRFTRILLTNAATKQSVALNLITVDGVNIVDCNKNSVNSLVSTLSEVKQLPNDLTTIDALLVDDSAAAQASYVELQGILKPRVMVLRTAVSFDKVDQRPIDIITHNTLAISKSIPVESTRWVKLAEVSWPMTPALSELFAKKEAVCKSSRQVFAELSVKQMNFQPNNGTHTPRWNAEHMMGRELLFFSQIYHAVEPSIPIMDLNPKQMPPDYRMAHADWTGSEESLQMERVECMTRRFAYLLDGMDLDKTAKGSAFWSPRALLKQMERHYREHTANVIKKMVLAEWPSEP